jgi:acetolactate synthase-1/2/3 large subunit
MKIKVSDYIAQFIKAQGVTHVFELVGGMITHMLDSLRKEGDICIVSMHHEQGAAFAVDGMGRITGIPSVAMATSGPGATNLLTGIGSCYFDSVPAVFITGQVNRHELKGSRSIRQLGFQETDIVTMARPITKAAWLVEAPEDVPALLAEAFSLALSGRPGPVLLDIPMDVQRALIEVEVPELVSPLPPRQPDMDDIQAMLTALSKAEKPLILAGGGLRAAGAQAVALKLIEQLEVPVVHSLMAVDLLPFDHPLRVGLIGSYGNRWANHALGEADFILVLGSRLDIRQTGADTDSFSSGKTIFHVDCEAGEINNRVSGCFAIHTELKPFLEKTLPLAAAFSDNGWQSWTEHLDRLQKKWPDTLELTDFPGINPNCFMLELSKTSCAAKVFSVDVGQHQMWAAQSLRLSASQQFITSGGMGAMGFALPAAIGAAFAVPNYPVVAIVGDGSIQLNIQELQTIVRNHLPVKIVVIDNGCHGMVRQFQESYFDSQYQSTYWGYSAPDFTAVAKAYGIPAAYVDEPKDIPQALARLWAVPNEPYLLTVKVSTYTNTYPKMAFGRPITEMEPFVKPVAMEST